MNIEQEQFWRVGDVIKNRFDEEWTIIFRSGILVVCVDYVGNATKNYTCDELYRKGWRLKSTPNTTFKVTMQEIADKFGVPANKITII